MKIQFKSDFKKYGPIPFEFTENDIKNETMYFRSTWDFINSNNPTPIIRAFQSQLPGEFLLKEALIDVKVHMLFPNMYPCIPGWHLDDVPRTRVDKQPDHVNPIYKSRHCAMIVGDASRTQFMNGNLSLPEYPDGSGRVIYKEWDKRVNTYHNFGHTWVHQVYPNWIYEFNWQTFHRGMPATHRGWRWFGRVTIDSELEPRNEIRKQANVYTTTDISW